MKKFICMLIISSFCALYSYAQEPLNFWEIYDFKHSTWNTVVTTKVSELEYLPYIGNLQLYVIAGWNASNGRSKYGGAIVKEITFPKSNVTLYVGGWAGYESESKLTGGIIGGVSILVR